MSILGKFACAAVALGAVAASPALADTPTELFAQFVQSDSAKAFQYRNITDDSLPYVASLNVDTGAKFSSYITTGLGVVTPLSGPAVQPVNITLSALATEGPQATVFGMVGQKFTGTLNFTLAAPLAGLGGVDSTNVLTVNFTDAVLMAAANGGALQLSFAPDTISNMTSGFFDFSNVTSENFALSFSSATTVDPTAPAFTLSGGRIADFNANVTGTFASAPPPIPHTPPAVPEPATWALMLLGFGAVGTSLRGRRQRFVAA